MSISLFQIIVFYAILGTDNTDPSNWYLIFKMRYLFRFTLYIFKAKNKFFSLTVSHSTHTRLEDTFGILFWIGVSRRFSKYAHHSIHTFSSQTICMLTHFVPMFQKVSTKLIDTLQKQKAIRRKMCNWKDVFPIWYDFMWICLSMLKLIKIILVYLEFNKYFNLF